MTYTTIMSIIVLHWIADFVLQSDWQAKNKSSNNIALSIHVGIYTLCLILFAVTHLPVRIGIGWAVANGAIHFVVDYITSRINTYLWSKGRVHDFFVSVGLDQTIHYACLFGTLFYLDLV